jgi:hypothetical protein
MNASPNVRLGHSRAADPRTAVAEFHVQVAHPETALVIFFCSSHYDRDVLAEEMNRLFPGVEVVGCTTAGEIGEDGYVERSLSGISFPKLGWISACGRLERLKDFTTLQGRNFPQILLRQLESQGVRPDGENTFAFLLVDGLSLREEPVSHTLQDTLGSIRLVGGSAGDNMRFENTWVFHEGAFHSDCAVLVLLHTIYEFRLFKTQHFISTEERLVVTSADAANRVVNEINGLPAVDEYARLIGVPPDKLVAEHFAASPIVIMLDGTDYVRAIQKANPDGSLTFYCAIDEGLVLRVAKGMDLLADLEHTFVKLRAHLGEPQAVLTCDCILRNLEIQRGGLREVVSEIYRRNHAVGFSTYGEQYCGVHVNQTLTGVAIGQKVRIHG